MAQFHLTIRTGNAGMETGADVAAALRDVAKRLDGPETAATFVEGAIKDVNGNTVGRFEVDPCDEPEGAR